MKLSKYVLLLSLFSGMSMAGVEGYQFVDTNGTTRLVEGSESLLNPASTFTVYASAGLDRQLYCKLIDTSTTVAKQEITSDWVRVSDRQTFDGREFYGKQLQFNAVPDGTYSVQCQILDGSGAVQDTTTKPIVIDTLGPSYSGVFGEGNGGYGTTAGTAPVWYLGVQSNAGYDFVGLDVDDLNGIKSASVVAEAKDGSGFSKQFSATYNSLSKKTFSDMYVIGAYLPQSNLEIPFDLTIVITDNAGNVTRTTPQRVYYDNYSGAPSEPYGVYDPDILDADAVDGISGFAAYVPGMTVKTNPITLLYKVPVSNTTYVTQAGLNVANGVGTVEKQQVGDYVYFKVTAPFGISSANQIKWVDFGRWAAGGIGYSLVLSPNAPQSPSLQGAYFKLNGQTEIPLWSQHLIQNSELPTQMDNFRFVVSVRTYDQQISFKGQSCIIPAGQAECSIPLTIALNQGSAGYLHDGITLRSYGLSNPELIASAAYAEPTWNDQYYPVMNSYSFDANTGYLTAYITQPSAGAWFDRLELKSATLLFGSYELQPVSKSQTGADFEIKYNLNALPDGSFPLKLKMIENHGPTTVTDLFNYTIEKTPPVITISNNGNDSFSSIIGLDNLSVQITDASPITVGSIVLTGGPANDSIYLAYSDKGNGTYALEYPRIYPSMVSGDTYTLKVTAEDSYHNASTKSAVFTYQPPNLVSAGDINVLSISQAITDNTDNPIAQVNTGVLRTEEGSLAAGPQEAYFTLRSDAEISVKILGQVVAPGQTVTLSVTPVDGIISIPLYPAQSGMTGKSPFMFEVPQITSTL